MVCKQYFNCIFEVNNLSWACDPQQHACEGLEGELANLPIKHTTYAANYFPRLN